MSIFPVFEHYKCRNNGDNHWRILRWFVIVLKLFLLISPFITNKNKILEHWEKCRIKWTISDFAPSFFSFAPGFDSFSYFHIRSVAFIFSLYFTLTAPVLIFCSCCFILFFVSYGRSSPFSPSFKCVFTLLVFTSAEGKRARCSPFFIWNFSSNPFDFTSIDNH